MYLIKTKLIMLLGGLLVLPIFLCSHANAMNKQEMKNLASSPKWQALLRYKKNWYGKLRSLEDSPKYFLNKNGKYDPLAELKTNIEYFKNRKNYPGSKQLAACVFPARYQYLNSKLNFKSKVNLLKECADYATFVEKTQAKTALVVFSSYFIEKPASAFGHTLLRLSRRDDISDVDRMQLLDYGVNFAANDTTSNPIAYSILGIIGGFDGTFAIMPYFYKVREYNDFESRDLWSYKLKLNQDQMQFLMAHTWEMGVANFNYFYFDENCSYHLLALLDAVNPQWQLADSLPSIVVPIDTLKVLQKKGLIEHVYYKASQYSRLQSAYTDLDDNQKELFFKSIDDEYQLANSSLSKLDQAQVMDALIEYFDFNHAEAILKEEQEITRSRMKILSQRAKLPVRSISHFERVPMELAPHRSHPTRRVGLSGGRLNNQEFVDFEYRFSFHEILDDAIGFSKWTTLEMGKLNFRKIDDKVVVQDFYLINVENLQPMDRLFQKLSYRVQFGLERLRTGECIDCKSGFGEFSLGMSKTLNSNFNLYSFIGTRVNHNEHFSKNDLRLALAPELGIYYKSKILSAKAYAKRVNSLTTTEESYGQYGGNLRLNLNQVHAIEAKLSRAEVIDEYQLGYYYFF